MMIGPTSSQSGAGGGGSARDCGGGGNSRDCGGGCGVVVGAPNDEFDEVNEFD